MKLSNIIQFIPESFDEEPETDRQALEVAIRQKERAIKHEYHRVYLDNKRVALTIPNAVEDDNFPGGSRALRKALDDESWIRIAVDVVAPNVLNPSAQQQRAVALYDRFIQLAQVKDRIHKKLLVAINAATEFVAQSVDRKTQSQIPEERVPATLSSGVGGKFQNPYFASDIDRYAGAPEGFPWTPHMHKVYNKLKDILKKNGIPGFTVAFGSVFIDPVNRGAGLHNFPNFAVIAANGSFVWRRYDRGGGSGQNWVYVNGQKMNAQRFISFSTSSDPTAQATFTAWVDALK